MVTLLLALPAYQLIINNKPDTVLSTLRHLVLSMTCKLDATHPHLTDEKTEVKVS